MKSRPVRLFIIGQILLYGGLLVCAVLDPYGVVGSNRGISYYGVHWDTIIPYLIALWGSAIFGGLAALKLGKFQYAYRMRYGMLLFAFLTIGVAVTPYKLLYLLHTGFGSLLFALQLSLTGWFTFWPVKDWRSITLWSLELLAGLISAWYLIEPSGYLFLSQLAFQICFGGLLTYLLIRLEALADKPSAKPA
ncbi:MAG TPA: hypothetical protein VFK03_00045 [Candidatus Saccharimonadales bacterium]|nr:hypothetical protein [Candidatus Saccharimonadales bacterium]